MADLASIEHLHDDHVDGLLEGLQQFRQPMLAKMGEKLEEYVMAVVQGEPPIWRIKFEAVDWDMLKGENMTDEELLELCEPDYAGPEEPEGPSELQ